MNLENVRANKRTKQQLQEALDYAENILPTILEPLLA
jgi:hypothetical protein